MSVPRFRAFPGDRRRREFAGILIVVAVTCGVLAGCAARGDSIPLTTPGQRDLAMVMTDDQQFCATVTRQMSALPAQPTGDVAGSAATLGANFAELAAIAPPEIRSDLQLLAHAFQGAGSGGADGETGSSAMSALTHYVDYLGKHCGIVVPLDTGAATTTS